VSAGDLQGAAIDRGIGEGDAATALRQQQRAGADALIERPVPEIVPVCVSGCRRSTSDRAVGVTEDDRPVAVEAGVASNVPLFDGHRAAASPSDPSAGALMMPPLIVVVPV